MYLIDSKVSANVIISHSNHCLLLRTESYDITASGGSTVRPVRSELFSMILKHSLVS